MRADAVTLRSRIIWQDSLLSISYDRATSTTALTRWDPLFVSWPDGLPYVECMLRFCTIALDVVTRRAAPMSMEQEVMRIEKRRDEVAAIDVFVLFYLCVV